MSDIKNELPAPTFFERDENNLVKGLEYHFTPDGRIDWVKMINPQHVVFNSKSEDALVKAYGKTSRDLNYAALLAEGVQVDPRHLLVLLMGFVELADLRGYVAAKPTMNHVVSYPPEAAIASCTAEIQWIPNREEPFGKISYGTADATMENTGGWGYLSAMAGNRAFVRAVRQGLRIPILGFDEIAKKDVVIPEAAPQSNTAPAGSPTALLQKSAELAKITFTQVKEGATGKYRAKIESDPAAWNDWADVPPRDCLSLIKIIKSKK